MGVKEKGAWERGTRGKENMVIIMLRAICLGLQGGGTCKLPI